MNVDISGGGKITEGTYERIRISGSGKILGPIVCDSMSVSGGTQAEADVEVKGKMSVSGSFKGISVKAHDLSSSGSLHLDGNMEGANLSVSGSCKVNGNIVCTDKISVSGGLTAGGKVHADIVKVSGGITAKGDIEGEKIIIGGGIHSDGIVNGEDILIQGGGNAVYVGGANIYVGDRERNEATGFKKLLYSLSFNPFREFKVEEAIEGDIIFLEDTKALSVSGQTITIGKNCVIDKVRYSGSCNIHKTAKVNMVEKIEHGSEHLMIEE